MPQQVSKHIIRLTPKRTIEMTICICMHFDDIYACTDATYLWFVTLSPFLQIAQNARSKSNELREQGNMLFKQNEYCEAIEKNTRAAEACSGHDLQEKKTKTLCDSSLSHLKLKEPWKALLYAQWAVRSSPKSDKVYLFNILNLCSWYLFFMPKVLHSARHGCLSYM